MQKRDENMENLSDELIKEIVKDYDDGMKIKEIIAKYGLELNMNQFIARLPHKPTRDICKKCGGSIVVKRRRTAYSNHPFCKECGHFDDECCKCEFCEAERRKIEEAKQARRNQLLAEKRDIVIEKWGPKNEEKIKFDDLSYEHKIAVGIILFASKSRCDGRFRLADIRKKSVFPFEKNLIKTITELMMYKVIYMSPNTPLESFSYEGEILNYENIEFEFNVDFGSEDCLKQIKAGNICLENEEFRKVWEEIAVEELLQYLIFRMEQIDFDFSPGEKTYKTLREMVSMFSVLQCFNIIHHVIKSCYLQYGEGKISKEHATNSIIWSCSNYSMKAQQQGWNIHDYYWPREYGKSIAAEFIYSKVLRIGEMGRRHRVSNKNTMIEDGVLNEGCEHKLCEKCEEFYLCGKKNKI